MRGVIEEGVSSVLLYTAYIELHFSASQQL